MIRGGVVYIADFGDGKVKIGASKSPGHRAKSFARDYPSAIVQVYTSGRMAFPGLVESVAIALMSERFECWRGREWFVAPLAAAVETVNCAIAAHWHPSAIGKQITPWPEK